MAGNAGGEGKNGGGGSERQLMQPALRPEERSLNTYVLGHTYLLMAMTGLGYLALTWSTVVLLGGFVTGLGKKDFWCLTVISMIEAARIFNDLADRLFPNFLKIAGALVRWYFKFVESQMQSPNEAMDREIHGPCDVIFKVFFVLWKMYSALFICYCSLVLYIPFMSLLTILVTLYVRGPLVCIALSLWRIRKRDYDIDPSDHEKANLMPALDLFYSLVLCQGALYVMWCIVDAWSIRIAVVLRRGCGFPEEWGGMLATRYISNARSRCWQNPNSISDRKVIDYAVELLDSESWEDNLDGARMLDAFITQGADVRLLLLPSRPKVQKLFDTLGWRCGPERNRETREAAARVVADLAGELHLAQFPGSLQCVASLLQDEATAAYLSGKQESRRIKTKSVESHLRQLTADRVKKREKAVDRMEERRQRRKMAKEERNQRAMMKKQGNGGQGQEGHGDVQQQTQLPPPPQRVEQQQQQPSPLQQVEQQPPPPQRVDDGSTHGDSRGDGCNQLILQGLTILERLASDHQNCGDICTTPGLLAKIKAPLYSATFKDDVKNHDWARVVSGSLKVLNQIVHAPVDAGRSLFQEIVSNNQAMCNLKWILESSNGADPELQVQAMEIMTQLALDASNSLSVSVDTKKNLIGMGLEIFIANIRDPGSTLDPLKATAGRMLVLMSTNSKAYSDTITKAAGLIIKDKENSSAHLTEITEDKKTVVDHFIKVLENYCTHCDWNEEHKKIVTELVLPKVITVILSIKSDRPENSDEKENKPQAKRWTIFKRKNNRGNEANLKTSAPGKDEENPQTIAPGTGVRSQACTPGDKNIVQKTSSLRDQNKSSDRQNEEQTASTKELQEALLTLALVICAKLINAQDAIQETALGGTPFVVKLKTIIDDNCQPTADSLRIVKLCGYIAASVMSFEPYADCFRNNEFAKSFTKASKIMSNLESCMIFAGTDFGVKKILRPLLSELEKKVSNLEKKEVQLG
ncbi:unnamed protein product [Urochloa decumbens]|uniref:Uncharacterized protein n=1 Tax=Urochloa decumbens TaxID=240449 RepID=A0ABC9B4R9_9POAL